MTTPPPRRQIEITGEFLRDLASVTWLTVQETNDPPTLFRHGELLVDLTRAGDGDHTRMREVKKVILKSHLDKIADFMKWTRQGGLVPARPPNDVLDDMLVRKVKPVPRLRGVSGAPVFAPNGDLTLRPGYDPGTSFYLDPLTWVQVPDVPDEPDQDDIAAALRLIMDDLLGDFPFASDADRAHAVSLLLLPFVRTLIDLVPLHLIESATPGSGKGLLADVLTIPATGGNLPVMTEARDEDETRKRITSKLLQGPQFILIDNVRRGLDSGALSAALTASLWEDRLLGASRTVTLPNGAIWIATANNPSLSVEVARRTIAIRLDPSMEKPWEREDFKHPDLRAWALDHRGDLIWAALTLIRAWFAAGQPAGRRSLGSFEKWARVMGGILEVVGVGGFLGNVDRVYEAAEAEIEPWREFCTAWWEEFGDTEIPARDLFGIVTRRELLLELWQGRDDLAARTRFGQALGRMKGRVIDPYRIHRAGEDAHAGVATWKLERREPPPETKGVGDG